MEYFIAAIILLILGLIVFFVRKGKKNSVSDRHAKTNLPPKQPGPTHLGFKLTAPDPATCCAQAQEMLAKVIAINDVPTAVPLPGCNRKNSCRCRLEKKYETRDGKERRETEDRRDSIRFEDIPDRRNHIDRRKHQSMWNKDRN